MAEARCFHVLSGPALPSFSILMKETSVPLAVAWVRVPATAAQSPNSEKLLKSQVKEGALLFKLFWIFPIQILERKQVMRLLPTEKNVQRKPRVCFK